MENTKEIQHVVWDGDNTIWDWMAYAVPAYEAMCDVISDISGRSSDDTASAMKQFYTAAGTLENEGLVQGLQATGFFSHLSDFNLDQTIIRVHTVFSQIRQEKLHVYPGISSVMKEINRRGLEQIVITDAPKRQAQSRLRHSRLGSNISRGYAMPTAEISDLPAGFGQSSLSESGPPFYDLLHEKPHVDLEAIFQMTRAEVARHVAIIGDNDAKDMALARNYGCLGIHARYGATDPDLGRRIARFAPPRVASRNMQIDAGLAENSNANIYPVDRPQDILEVLK